MAKKDEKKKKHFFKDFKAELKRVNWPTAKQLVNNTLVVVVIVLITAAIVFILDIVFDLFNNYGINKLKANVKNKNTEIVQTDNTIENETNTTTNEITVENNETENN